MRERRGRWRPLSETRARRWCFTASFRSVREIDAPMAGAVQDVSEKVRGSVGSGSKIGRDVEVPGGWSVSVVSAAKLRLAWRWVRIAGC